VRKKKNDSKEGFHYSGFYSNKINILIYALDCMVNHFDYSEWFNSLIGLEFNLEESVFRKNIIKLNELFEKTSNATPSTLKTSEVLTTIYARSNLNYLLGSFYSVKN